MPTSRIAILVINRDGVQSQLVRPVNAENLDWRVLDVDAGDGGRSQAVCVEKLWLCLATVGTLAVPPAGSAAIEEGAAGTGDGNALAGNRDEWSGPFSVAEGCGAFEDDLSD